jgi:hypothetical protein
VLGGAFGSQKDKEQNILHTCFVSLLAASANKEADGKSKKGGELKEGIYQPPSGLLVICSGLPPIFQLGKSHQQLSLLAKLKHATYM